MQKDLPNNNLHAEPIRVKNRFLKIQKYNCIQKRPSMRVLIKRCSENMKQIYRRTAMPKCDFNSNFIEITLWHGCYPVNLLHIFRTTFPKNNFRTTFPKNNSRGLLLHASLSWMRGKNIKGKSNLQYLDLLQIWKEVLN